MAAADDPSVYQVGGEGEEEEEEEEEGRGRW